MNKEITFFLRLLALIFAALLALRILYVMVQRVPGVVVALCIIALMVLGVAYYKRGLHSIGIHSRKSAALAMIATAILLVISTAILINLG